MQKYLQTLLVVFLGILFSCEFEKEQYVPFTAEGDARFIVENYEKSEVYIPMRDGTKLFTSIYVPKKKDEKYPILMNRTPYGVKPYGTEPSDYKKDLGPNMRLTRDLYIYVYQDVRGKYMSEGEFINMTPHSHVNEDGKTINESTDTFDTIEWLLENIKNNNGKVGQWGISYPGFYTAAGIIDSHPALVAASPQAPIADWFFDDFHHHGAFFLPHTFNFFSTFGQPRHGTTKESVPKFIHGTKDGYEFFKNITPLKKANEMYFGDSIKFWNEILEHPNYDQFWQEQNILPHLKNINCAVLTIGGWFDAEDLYGPLKVYQSIEEKNPKIFNALVMGPWGHGGWKRTTGESMGDVYFGDKTSNYYANEIIYPFFAYHLKGEGNADLPEATVFETGTNQWKTFDTWPPENLKFKNLYFNKKQALSYTPPKSNEHGMEIFISDPENPVPFTEYKIGMPKRYMSDDQRFLQDRKDVVYYQTEPLEADLTIAGPVTANLMVTTDQGDADWVVKLIDVYPKDHPPFPHQPDKDMGGYQQMVRSEVLRGRFRNDYENPEPFTPNALTQVKVPLQDVFHTFKKGHRLMVQIHSSWFPLVDINPQKYVDNIYMAEPSDFIKAKHKISRSGSDPSFLRIGVLE
ncbi:CocE/NonD family hydrolase [Reichenbachiella sp. MALMAid0571]|uniref:CocE/NonD family hydrolase n=1 Tax=Reichenbachiella sp. MALMAid0571 TaxID=3143939 RepID=UPI0032DEF77F